MRTYTKHMNEVQSWGQQSPENMLDVATLALLSIRQHWHLVGDQLDDVRERGEDSVYLFGFKKTGYRYIKNNIDWLYAVTTMATSDYELLDAWSTVPGLGLVKAGFVIQMLRGCGGCIDSHNMKEYGIPAAQLRFSKTLSTKARAVKLRGYLSLCSELGGSEYLWKQWCYLMWGKYPKNFATPQAVSRAHVHYLKGLPALEDRKVNDV